METLKWCIDIGGSAVVLFSDSSGEVIRTVDFDEIVKGYMQNETKII